jgi:hypothetical protein
MKKKKNDIHLYLENYKKNKSNRKNKSDRNKTIDADYETDDSEYLESKKKVKKDVTFFSDDDY